MTRKSDEDAKAYRAFCEHGKVRVLLCDPMNDDPPNPTMAADAYKELSRWGRKGIRYDLVSVVEARSRMRGTRAGGQSNITSSLTGARFPRLP